MSLLLCVFDIYKDDLELYYKILNGDYKVKFRFGAISKKEFEEREKYFARNKAGVSESRLFQNELCLKSVNLQYKIKLSFLCSYYGHR